MMNEVVEYDTDTPIEELSDEVLVKMTEAEIQLRIKLAKAQEGIPILSPPEEPPKLDLPPPDGKFWEASLFDGFLFNSVDDANRALELFRELGVCKKHDPYQGPKTFTKDLLAARYGSGTDDFSVSPIEIRSRDQHNSLRPQIEADEEAKKIFKNEKERYERAQKQAEDLEKEIRRPIHEAHTRQNARKEAEWRMKEYMQLAKDDFSIALGFYRKAYSPKRYVIEYLCSKANQPLPENLPEEESDE